MKFGTQLRNFRKANGWTQSELAAKLGMQKTAISKYESDENEPSFETINKLAVIFQVSVSELLGEEVKDTQENKEAFVIELLNLLVKQGKIKDVNNISKETMDMIINAIKMEAQKIIEAES